jgi:hypothetical protein
MRTAYRKGPGAKSWAISQCLAPSPSDRALPVARPRRDYVRPFEKGSVIRRRLISGLSTPRLLFEEEYIFDDGPVVNIDVHPDGRRLLMLEPSRRDPPVTHINVVLRCFEELKQRFPATRD